MDTKQIEAIILKNIHKMMDRRQLPKIEFDSLSENAEVKNEKCIFYYINGNLTIKQARFIEDNYNKTKKTLCIYNGTSTCQARQLLKTLKTECFSLDFFHYVPIDYQNNIQYELLTDIEKSKLKQQLNLKHLPRIYDQDVVSRYYGAQLGDIFKIQRSNTVYYRIVVLGNI